MKKTKYMLIGIAIIFLLGHAVGPTILSDNTLKNSSSTNHFEIIKNDQTGITLAFSLSNYEISEKQIQGTTFNCLNIPGYGTTNTIGRPKIPILREKLCIPDDASSITISIKDSTHTTTSCNDIIPVQQPLLETETNDEFIMNNSFYTKDENYPSSIVEITGKQPWDDLNILSITVQPIQFNPARQLLTIHENLIIEIKFESSGFTLKRSSSEQLSIYENIILNYNFLPIESNNANTGKSSSYKYLAITDPILENASKPLIQWKHNKGLKSKLVNTTITGSSSTEIKDYISTFYNNNIDLQYVLLIGDVSLVPWYTGWGVTGSDYWYGDVVGDIYPELSVGRITANTPFEVTQQVTKILKYERNPQSGNWFDKVLLAAHEEGSPGKYEGCSEDIRTALYNDTYIFDTAYGSQGVTNANVSDRVNIGRNILNYRGHGASDEWCSGWTTGDPSGYTTAHAHGLQNAHKTPIHYCIACSCGDLSSYNECLGEAFLKDNNSAVAFLGASEPSYTYPNHRFDKHLFDASGNQEIYSIGMISNYANSDLITYYGIGDLYLQNVKMYLWLGDPAMEIWTATPKNLTISHPTSVIPGTSQFPVEVTHNDTPVKDALVCISNGNDIYHLGYTNDSGEIVFNMSTTTFGEMNVTVTKHNFKPYQTTILIPAESPLKQGWNFISTPANHPVGTNNIMIKHNNSYYNWSEATTTQNPTNTQLIDANFFGWNKTEQTYELTTTLHPGEGYWMYCFKTSEMLMQCMKTPPAVNITNLQDKWNIISHPAATSITKTNLSIDHNGTLYNWSHAVQQNIIDANLYGWNRINQTYDLQSILKPTEAYWMYSYNTCEIIHTTQRIYE